MKFTVVGGRNRQEKSSKTKVRKRNFTAQTASVLTLVPLFYVLVEGSYSTIQIALEPGTLQTWLSAAGT